MKKICVVFPGIGYTCDRSLLHFAGRIAQEKGYEVLKVSYSGFESDIRGSDEKIRSAVEFGLRQAKSCLREVDFKSYDDILFVSKSIGTAISSLYALEKGIVVRNVFFTPVEYTFRCFMQSGIVFTGTNDQWASCSAIRDLCAKKGLGFTEIPGANHSLETGSALQDVANLKGIMDSTEKYIGKN